MIDATLLLASQARVKTQKARGYLVQLCKHFAHKTDAAFADNRGRIRFTAGRCELDAKDAASLVITVSTEDLAQLSALEDAIDRHLRRFAFREDLAIQWTRSPGA